LEFNVAGGVIKILYTVNKGNDSLYGEQSPDAVTILSYQLVANARNQGVNYTKQDEEAASLLHQL